VNIKLKYKIGKYKIGFLKRYASPYLETINPIVRLRKNKKLSTYLVLNLSIKANNFLLERDNKA
jgi:hypothetical protein